MRCTVDFDRSVSGVIYRRLRCGPPFCLVSRGLRTNCTTRSQLIGRERIGRNSSWPATSYFKNHRRHLPTVALVTPDWPPICTFILPDALRKIILARSTDPAENDRELSRCSRCYALKINAAFGRPIAIRSHILHGRRPYCLQYYCHLIMGEHSRACP
jgi:hypothetical protein